MNLLVKYGWYALLIAILGDILVPFILAPFYQGYSHMSMSISALGNPHSPVRGIFNFWMLLEGLLFLLALPTVYNHFNSVSKPLTNTVIAFVAIFAVGACMFTCFFSVNEMKEVVTTASKVHGIGSVIGFMLFLFVPLLLSILEFKCNDISNGVIAVVSFIIALVFFVLFVMSDKPEFNNTIIANEGLWQRLNLLFMYIPLVTISVRNILGVR